MEKNQVEKGERATTRLWGIDAIRFVMAMWVTVGHYSLPPIIARHPDHGLLKAFAAFYWALVNGPSAVIVFFLVSGLCIHFPNRNRKAIDSIGSYYARRLIRVGLPSLVGIILVSALFGVQSVAGYSGILWSILAEIIYYLLYPLLLALSLRFGWVKMIVASYVAAYVVVLCVPHNGNYPSFGLHLTWIVGLPCWLLGCLLAQQVDSMKPTTTPGRIWLWRAGLLGASLITSLLRWHLPQHFNRVSAPTGSPESILGFGETFDFFALFAFFWLREEVRYYLFDFDRKPNQALEAAGAFSFSLYLVHLPAAMAFEHFGKRPEEGLTANLMWLALLTLSLVLSYIFYKLVEYPSHLLAIHVGRRLRAGTVPIKTERPKAAVAKTGE